MNTLFDKPRTAEHDANTKPARGEPRAIPSFFPPNGERAGVRDDGASDVAYAYKPGKPTKPINFYCAALEARSVCLMGDFNGWNPASHPMERRRDGWWFLQVPLTHGHHQYLFVVDGTPTLDPHATGAARNERYAKVSLIAVS